MEDQERVRAEVTWFNQPKGYGYLRTEAGQAVFVHHREIEGDGFRTLESGQQVTFRPGDDGRGPTALAVRVVGEGTPDRGADQDDRA